MTNKKRKRIQKLGAAYGKRAARFSREMMVSLGICASDAKLTPLAVRWWAAEGAGMRSAPLGKLVIWKSLFRQRPKLAKIPVIVRRPKPDAGWDSAVARLTVLPSGKLRGISIHVNLCKHHLPHPQTFLDTFAHEIAHFIQAEKGTLKGNLTHKQRGQSTHPLELEAIACGQTVPLVPWPKNLLGSIDDFPREIFDCMLPAPDSI